MSKATLRAGHALKQIRDMSSADRQLLARNLRDLADHALAVEAGSAGRADAADVFLGLALRAPFRKVSNHVMRRSSGSLPLSDTQRNTLEAISAGCVAAECHARTIRALKKKGYLDDSGSLTKIARDLLNAPGKEE